MSDSKKSFRRPHIKAVSREDPPKGLEALKACRCFPEVERRTRLGWASIDLARMIQDEYGELGHLAEKYVGKLVDMFRKEIPPAELAVTSRNSTIARNAQKKLATGLNELEELEKLYEMQMARIYIDVETEKKINKLFPTTGREVFVAMKLLKQSSDLKGELGIYKKQLGTMEITAQGAIDVGRRYSSEAIGRVMTDAESRRKVMGMVDTLMKLGGRATLDAVYNETDGPAPGVIDAECSESVSEES